MIFDYTAKEASGKLTSGAVEAVSAAAARQALREKGLFPMSMAARATSASSAGKPLKSDWLRKRVPRREVLMFTQQLVILCRSGVDLADALQISSVQCPNPVLKRALEEVYRDLSDGLSVSAAMANQVQVFGEAYVAAVRAGEASSQITEVLVRLAEMLRNEIRLRSTVRAALTYPVVLLGVSAVVMVALVGFVLPQFAQVFDDMGVSAPLTTKLLLETSSSVRTHGLAWALGLLGAGYGVKRLVRTSGFCRVKDALLLNAALVGQVTRALLVGRSFRLMGTMLQSGVPLLEGLQLCRSTISNRHFRAIFDALEREVLAGRGLGQTLLASSYIPAGAAQMMLTAERSGRMGQVMQMVGEYYEDDGERKLQDFARLLEPVIIVIMGGLVALIVASVMLPMLDVSTGGH
jgi:type II secretory pathway component PulF